MPGAEDFARTTDGKVPFGDLETVGRRRDRFKTQLRLRGRGVGQEQAEAPARCAADPAAELVQLCQPEPLRVLDDHD